MKNEYIHLHLLSFSPWSCSSLGGWPSSVSVAARALLLCDTPGQIHSGSCWSSVCWPHVLHISDGPGTTERHEICRCVEKTSHWGSLSASWTPVILSSNICCEWTYLLIILRCTILRIIILSAQSLRKSDIFCFNAGFISCFAMTLRWSHDALHLRSIWARLSWSWSKST